MAKGGAFNVSQLIRELGLKTISGDTMRVLETVQPTLPVGQLEGLTPPHVPPSAMFGVTAASGAGLNATLEVQCLAPDGLWIGWAVIGASASIVGYRVTTVTHAAGLGVLASAGQLSRDAVLSVVRSGGIAAVGGPSVDFPSTFGGNLFFADPLYVPRGSFFSLQSVLTNVPVFLGFKFKEVPAAPAL